MARSLLVEFHDGTTSAIHHVEQMDEADAYSVKFYDRDMGLIEQLSKAEIKRVFPIAADEHTTS
jgi:hypothetical protein